MAGLEPEMAAKIAQAIMVTTARPPGRCPNQARRASIRYLAMPPRDMATPAKTKAGMARRGGDSREANILWTIIKRLKSLVVARIIMAAIAREMAMGTFKRNRAMKILKSSTVSTGMSTSFFHFFHPIATAVLQNLIEFLNKPDGEHQAADR